MRNCHNILISNKIYLFFLFLLLTNQNFAQENQKSDSLSNTETSNLLMLSLSYTSNNMKTKNYEYDRIPAILTNISFFSKKGFFGALDYTNFYLAKQNTYEAELQFGYQKSFFKNLHLQTSYARRTFVGDTTYEGLAQKNTLALDANYTWKFLDFQVSNSFLNGKSNNYFLDLDLSASIDFDNLLTENDFLLINPTVSTSFGTDNWIFQNMSPAFENIVVNYLSRNGFESHTFEYQSFNIYVPIIYNIGNLGFMFNWFYSWPSAKLSKLSWQDQSGVLVSVYFTPKI